jgi:hypothetical protein
LFVNICQVLIGVDDAHADRGFRGPAEIGRPDPLVEFGAFLFIAVRGAYRARAAAADLRIDVEVERQVRL